jgi:hypothetical protein
VRFHDGARWTRHVANQGVIEIDEVEIDLREPERRADEPSWRSLSIWADAAGTPRDEDVAADRAGWHDDPSGRHRIRYHDGTMWTEYVGDDDGYRVDPI